MGIGYTNKSKDDALFCVSILLCFTVILTPALVLSQESNQEVSNARIYRSPEERREAGLGRELTDWLKVSGLIEVEKEFETRKRFNLGQIRHASDTSYNAQLAFELSLSEKITAEVNIETEYEQSLHTFLDEALLVIDLDPLELELGRLSLPFGEYYSHFITGPVLEIGETLAEGLVVGYAASDSIEVSAFTFKSEVDSINDRHTADWGINLEFLNEAESIKLGLSYVSDLAESDEQILEDFDNLSAARVGAWNAYALLGFDQFEITAEYLKAERAFSEFDAEFDTPSAWNLELAYFVNNAMQLSFRYEQSREIEEAPKSQYGINLTWRPSRYALLSLEFLKGEFKKGFLTDAEDNSITKSETIAVQIAIEF